MAQRKPGVGSGNARAQKSELEEIRFGLRPEVGIFLGPRGTDANDSEFLELNDATASRSLRRRMDRLLANLEAVTDADGEWFAERPSRIHRVREISKAEKAWIKATEFTVRPDRRIYVAVKQVRRGVRLRVTFMAAPLHRPEEFSDAAAKFYWDQAGGSNPQVHEIEEGLRRLTDGREKP